VYDLNTSSPTTPPPKKHGEGGQLVSKKKKIYNKEVGTILRARLAEVYGTNKATDLMCEGEIEKRLDAHIIL